jgi:hypothetical protein
MLKEAESSDSHIHISREFKRQDENLAMLSSVLGLINVGIRVMRKQPCNVMNLFSIFFDLLLFLSPPFLSSFLLLLLLLLLLSPFLADETRIAEGIFAHSKGAGNNG